MLPNCCHKAVQDAGEYYPAAALNKYHVLLQPHKDQQYRQTVQRLIHHSPPKSCVLQAPQLWGPEAGVVVDEQQEDTISLVESLCVGIEIQPLYARHCNNLNQLRKIYFLPLLSTKRRAEEAQDLLPWLPYLRRTASHYINDALFFYLSRVMLVTMHYH
jgi:hypothetical protein